MQNIMLICCGGDSTLFGPLDSLRSNDPQTAWGALPRIVHTCIMRMEGAKEMFPDTTWFLAASAFQFDEQQCSDLLFDRWPVKLDDSGAPRAPNFIRIECVIDLARLQED